MATNPFCESMGQKGTCMGALHPNPKFICLYQLNVTKQRKDLHLRFTLESRCVALNSKHGESVCYMRRKTAEVKLKCNMTADLLTNIRSQCRCQILESSNVLNQSALNFGLGNPPYVTACHAIHKYFSQLSH